VIEAQMWMSRHDPVKAAAVMRHAVQLAETAPLVADATMERRDAVKVRPLIPDELWMLLAARAHSLAVAEADDVISRYGSSDILSALAHHAKAAVQRRSGTGDGGAAEYNAAIAIAQSAGGHKAAAAIVETISAEAGADEAIRRINGYLAAVDGSRADVAAHDPHWDLLRIDLLRRNNELPAAAAEIDKMMTRLDSLPQGTQIDLLRLAVVVYLQDPSSVHTQKARAACLALLQRRPDDAWALNNMAIFCIDPARPSDLSKALDYGLRAYQSAGRTGEVDPRIADTYGWALAAAGRGEEAIQILTPLPAQLPIPEVQYHLAEAYLSSGNASGAWPHLGMAAQLIQRDERKGIRVDPNLRNGVANAFWRALRRSVQEGLKAVGASIR
jgi:tetratricopeptide (TPR) repeat protein